MKIHILTEASTRLAMDVARLLEADAVIAAKQGEITIVYPVSFKGNVDLDSLMFKRHNNPTDGNSFYAMPMGVEMAKEYLEGKFPVDYV